MNAESESQKLIESIYQNNTFLSQKMFKNVSVMAINISRYTNQLEVLPIFAILR